jgi:hypothetical protein
MNSRNLDANKQNLTQEVGARTEVVCYGLLDLLQVDLV